MGAVLFDSLTLTDRGSTRENDDYLKVRARRTNKLQLSFDSKKEEANLVLLFVVFRRVLLQSLVHRKESERRRRSSCRVVRKDERS